MRDTVVLKCFVKFFFSKRIGDFSVLLKCIIGVMISCYV
jgi:hypothetical protein